MCLKVVLLLGLIVASVMDIKKRQIWLPAILAVAGICLLCNYFDNQNIFLRLISSVGVVLTFTMIAKVSGGQLGMGDALLFGMTDTALGLWTNLILIYLSFAFAAAVGLVLIFIKKKKKTCRMPLAPCILLAYVCILMGGG